MDTSETYIKMCEKAEEIQKLADKYWDRFSIACWHSPNHVRCKGHFEDWHMAYKYCPVCGKPLKITPEYSICTRMEGNDGTWLPRQDQLQEMAFPDESTSVRQMVEPFYEFVKSTNLICASMEQLWLAFVMKERYSKLWNGEEWIKS